MDRGTGYGAAVARRCGTGPPTLIVPPVGRAAPARADGVGLAAARRLRARTGRAGAAAPRRRPRRASAAVLGPKVMDWADRRRPARGRGHASTRAGRRITGIEPREVDQGQHDGDRDVLAVGSAGMLVRRDVWDQVGGFDPAMPLLPGGRRLLLAGARRGLPGPGDHRRGRLPRGGLGQEAPAGLGRAPPRAGGPAQRAADAARQPPGRADAVRAGGQPGAVLAAHVVLPARQAAAARPWTSSPGSWARCSATRCGCSPPGAAGPRGRRAAYGRLHADIPPGRSVRQAGRVRRRRAVEVPPRGHGRAATTPPTTRPTTTHCWSTPGLRSGC